VFAELRPLVVADCPFVNLPETHKGRWGTDLIAEDMKKCVWVRPQIVALIEYLEWTESDHLRHSKSFGCVMIRTPVQSSKRMLAKAELRWGRRQVNVPAQKPTCLSPCNSLILGDSNPRI
jgi:hypothetical protein